MSKMKVVAALAVLVAGCTGPTGDKGSDGKPCQVEPLDGGGARIICPDSTVIVPPGAMGQNGAQGDAGTSCSVFDVDAGVKQIVCSDGTMVTVTDGNNGQNGQNGNNGLNGTNGVNGIGGISTVDLSVGAFHGADYLAKSDLVQKNKFLANVTVTSATADTTGKVTVNFTVTQPLADGGAAPVNALASNRYTVAKLVPAGVGEASNHWVPYITRLATVPADAGGYANPPGTTVMQAYRESNGTLTANGDGGFTYVYSTNLATVGYANDAGLVGFDQTQTHRVAVMLGGQTGPTGSAWFDFVPNGAAVTETRDIVETFACKQCHGAGFAAHGGDRTEVGVCVTCHNPTSVDAYSNNNVEMRQLIHNIHAGSEKPSVAGPDGIVWDDPTTPQDESADNQPYYIGPNRQDWWKIEFPAVLANCTKCHQGPQKDVDNWRQKPGKNACGTCHDDIDLAGGTNHTGGAQPNDGFCGGCHIPTGTETAMFKPVDATHDWTAHDPRIQPEFGIALSMTAPANGSYYVKGEAPQVSVALTDLDGGLLLDHTQIFPDSTPEGCPNDGGACPNRDGLFTATNFFVHGPRAKNNPVLTYKARSVVLSANAGPWDLSDGGSLVVKFDQNYSVPSSNASGDFFIPGTVTVSTKPSDGGVFFATPAAATRDEVIAWLNNNGAFNVRGIAYADELTGKLALRSRNLGPVYGIQLAGSAVTSNVFNNDQTLHIPGGFTPANTLAKLADGGVNDPRVSYTQNAITYQLDPVDDLQPGTYLVQVEIGDRGRINASQFKEPSVAFLPFQVGQAAEEKFVARNCSTCHENANTGGLLFDPGRHNKILGDKATDQCGGCHDQQPQAATGATWSGALAISKRVHAVHNGANLNYPNTTVGHADEILARAWDILYPRDIRDCEACHVKGTTSGSWKTKPARLPCSGCHDSDAATAHIKLMTYDPTPADAFSGDEQESCQVCH